MKMTGDNEYIEDLAKGEPEREFNLSDKMIDMKLFQTPTTSFPQFNILYETDVKEAVKRLKEELDKCVKYEKEWHDLIFRFNEIFGDKLTDHYDKEVNWIWKL